MRWPWQQKPPENPVGYYATGKASYDPVIPGTPNLKRVPRIPIRYLLMGLAVLVIFAVVRRNQPVPLTKSCITPAFAISNSSPKQLTPVRYSLTGPNGSYILGIDVAGFKVAANHGVTPVPDIGKPINEVEVATDIVNLSSCGAHGIFAVKVSPGTHTISLFSIGSMSAQLVSSQKLTVEPTSN